MPDGCATDVFSARAHSSHATSRWSGSTFSVVPINSPDHAEIHQENEVSSREAILCDGCCLLLKPER